MGRFLDRDRFYLARVVIRKLELKEHIGLINEPMKYWKKQIELILMDHIPKKSKYTIENILARNNLESVGEYEVRSIFDTIYKDMHKFTREGHSKHYTYRFKIFTTDDYSVGADSDDSIKSEPEVIKIELEVDDVNFPIL